MALDILMTHPGTGGERFVSLEAYRYVWWPRGWRSDDDPDYEGVPLTPPGLRVSGNLRVTSDAFITGMIRSDSPFVGATFDPGRITFGGIQGEGRVIVPAAMSSPTATMKFDDGCPRVVLPAGVRTDVYMGPFALEEWWLNDTLGCYLEWSNESPGIGNVRWEFELTETDIGTEKISQADVLAAKEFTFDGTGGTPSADGGTMTTSVFTQLAGDEIVVDPGPFASFFVCRISRLGAHEEDTLPGPVGLLEFSYVRGL